MKDEQPEWHVPAPRVAPVIDGEEYYPCLRKSLIQAQRQILVVGWEIHSEIELLRGEEAHQVQREDGWPTRFADLLLALVHDRADLHIHLLIWEGASLFVFERQPLPRMLRPWARHPRIQLVWDDDTPQLASQHQKVVVIDDRIAYSGGMDLTGGRWDSHEHIRNDPRRRRPGFFPSYGQPYHDLMLAMDGDAARTLGDWLRERWRRATGQELAPPRLLEEGPDPWPKELPVAFRDQVIGMALTQPAYAGRPEKRQVEATYLRQIAAARDLIFIETQYLTCQAVVDALCERLRHPEGPEVILILPFGCPGPVQAMSMDPWRDELLDQLRTADEHGRFGVYWGTLRGGSQEHVFKNAIYIHAKTMVCDRRLLRIGSANLNNRSMGLDSELDVYFEIDEGDEEAAAEIDRYRQRLLAYLLAVKPAAVAAAEQDAGSVVQAIESLRGGQQTLHPFDHRAGTFESTLPLPLELADPDRPLTDLDADRILAAFEDYKGLMDRVRQRAGESVAVIRRHKQLVAGAGVLLLVLLLWQFTPLHAWADRENLRRLLEGIEASPLGMLGVGGAFAVLATVGFPVSLLIAVTGAMLPFAWAVPLCLGGVFVAAFLDYSLGRFAPRSLCDWLSNNTLEKIVKRLRGLSVLGVAIARNIPIAPFTVVNIACGAIGVGQGRFLAGTLIGMLPSILLMSIFGQELGALLTDPTPMGLLRVAGLLVAVVTFAVLSDTALRRFERTRRNPGTGEDR